MVLNISNNNSVNLYIKHSRGLFTYPFMLEMEKGMSDGDYYSLCLPVSLEDLKKIRDYFNTFIGGINERI